MSRTTPVFVREGWKRAGPRRCQCPRCGAVVSSNALGRSAHARACPGSPYIRELFERTEGKGAFAVFVRAKRFGGWQALGLYFERGKSGVRKVSMWEGERKAAVRRARQMVRA